MKANVLLEDLIRELLQEIGKFGLCTAGYLQYKCAYDRLREFAHERGITTFCDELFMSYEQSLENRYMGGAIGRSRQRFLKRSLLLLRDYAVNGEVEWKMYVSNRQPYPVSPDLLFQHSRFIDHLRFLGRSKNTLESVNNLVRQFLLYFEDSGFRTLDTASVDLVPLFFQHLLATYSPTSLRTVASHIRSFLRFTDNERLLRAVPLRYTRRKSIIPILSEKEVIALKDVLQSRKISLRDKAIILLAWHTGLRACDIVKIRLEDIDWINDTISIVQSKTGTPLILPLFADVGNALSAYILNERVKTDDSSVFLRTHAPYTGLSGHSVCYAIVRRAFASAEIRIGTQRKGIHLLRHSAASRMLAKGVPITTISSMLGHSDKSSTDVYLSTDETRMKECALGLAQIPMNCGGLA